VDPPLRCHPLHKSPIFNDLRHFSPAENAWLTIGYRRSRAMGGGGRSGYAEMNPVLQIDPLGQRSRVCCRKIPKLPGEFRHCAIQIERDGASTTCGLFGGRFTPGEERGVGRIRFNHPFDTPGEDDIVCGPWNENCEADQCAVETANSYANPSKYKAVRGPNSNTFAGTIARACNLTKPDSIGSTPGWDDKPAPPAKSGRQEIPRKCKLP